MRSVYGARAARVTVSIPGGREIAKRTFNPRLGIQGGLSVLGTSGIVRPMSEKALKDALYAELRMRVLQGRKFLAFTFGNQGERALRKLYPEWELQVRLPRRVHGMLLWYCTGHGLFRQPL